MNPHKDFYLHLKLSKIIQLLFYGHVLHWLFSLCLHPLFVQFVNLCAHLDIQLLYLECLLFVQAGYGPTGSLHTSLVSIEMVAFCIGSHSVQSVVKRILCLVPPDPCLMPQFYVVRTSGISQTQHRSASRTNAATSQFKLNQVIETWVTSSIPISLSPSSRVTGLSHQSQWLCGQWESNPGCLAYKAGTPTS